VQQSYRYFRLGNMLTPDDRLREKLDYNTLKALRKDVEIKYIWALVAWLDPEDDSIHLSRVHAYDFDDFCIGDCGS